MLVDPIGASPGQYKVVVDNDQVRVLKIDYGPKERGVMHGHPEAILVCMTELRARFHLPDGSAEEIEVPAGGFRHMPATTHQPENRSTNRFEGFLVELK